MRLTARVSIQSRRQQRHPTLVADQGRAADCGAVESGGGLHHDLRCQAHGLLRFDLPDASDAAVRRAVFMEPDAEVQIAPVMGTDDLRKRCLRFGLSLSLTPSQ